ncbi:GroES-like protein [Auriculariales sp. MPI-PUGE-AT-0066]|nr:GroES-like protein [Auriculariales sp. MPI-PUGE-AT-0066]
MSLQHAAVLHGPKDLRLETRPVSQPAHGEAQIAIVASGLCGSDHHYYTHGRNGAFELKAPLVLGHEAAGVITALGPGVTHLRIGQRVAIEPGLACNSSNSNNDSHGHGHEQCRYCVDGRYNLCVNMRFCSSAKTFPHLDGTLQGYMNHPASLLFPLPTDDCSFEAAALAEPLSVTLHAARRASFRPGQTALVFGTGAIGVLACAVAKAQGASRVCAVDINPARLAFVQSRGFADSTVCLSRIDEADPIKRATLGAAQILEQVGEKEGFDAVFECSGAEPCIQMGVFAARPGGKLVLVDVLGVFRYHDTWPEALALLGSAKLQGVEDLVTHRLPLNRAREAFELVSRGVDDEGRLVMKVLVDSTTDETRGDGVEEGNKGFTEEPSRNSSIVSACGSTRTWARVLY